MDQNNKIRSGSVRLSTVATTTRQTPKTDFGSVMRNGLIRTGQVVSDGLRVAAPFIPGGAIVSAALAGANSAATMAGPSYAAGSGGGGYGSTASGLSMAGSGPGGSTGSYGGGSSGVLGIPGQSPTLNTALSQPSSNFAGSSSSSAVAGAGAGSSDAFNSMMSATREMSEFQASFNLQYLQLQQKIQIDTRQFNLISNIMKTKHDAAKNALNNVR